MFECTKNSKLGQVIPGQSLDTIAGNTFTTVHSNFFRLFSIPPTFLNKNACCNFDRILYKSSIKYTSRREITFNALKNFSHQSLSISLTQIKTKR